LLPGFIGHKQEVSVESEREQQEFLQAVEKSMAEVLSKEDLVLTQWRKDLEFRIYSLFTVALYRKHPLHGNQITVELPNFLRYNRFEFEGVISEEFNYRRKVALAFALEESHRSAEEFAAYRRESVNEKQWQYIPGGTIDLPSPLAFNQLLFTYRTSPYYKGLFIHQMPVGYLVVTLVAPPAFFTARRGFIRRLFATMGAP
jgi:muconolactone delta-isomerase